MCLYFYQQTQSIVYFFNLPYLVTRWLWLDWLSWVAFSPFLAYWTLWEALLALLEMVGVKLFCSCLLLFSGSSSYYYFSLVASYLCKLAVSLVWLLVLIGHLYSRSHLLLLYFPVFGLYDVWNKVLWNPSASWQHSEFYWNLCFLHAYFYELGSFPSFDCNGLAFVNLIFWKSHLFDSLYCYFSLHTIISCPDLYVLFLVALGVGTWFVWDSEAYYLVTYLAFFLVF